MTLKRNNEKENNFRVMAETGLLMLDARFDRTTLGDEPLTFPIQASRIQHLASFRILHSLHISQSCMVETMFFSKQIQDFHFGSFIGLSSNESSVRNGGITAGG
jgi:hypothetical protein